MKTVVLVNKTYRDSVFSDKYYDRMRKLGEVAVYDKDDFSDESYWLDFVKGANVIITSWDTPAITQKVLDVCPDLQAVLHAAGSVKPVISPEFIEKKIRITASACAIGEGVAESALGFAISACKGFYTLSRDTKNKMWREHVSEYVTDFYDINIGVISGGYVGRHMVKLLKSFHVNIFMYDPTLTAEQIAEIGATKIELNELMSTCDVVSVHAPSIPATENMLNKDNLCLMKDGAVLINTARGAIINEADLIAELEKGRIFACLDVTAPEPPSVENKLRFLDNVILTPHIAGTSTNGLRRIALHVCEELERLAKGEKMKAEINTDDLGKMA